MKLLVVVLLSGVLSLLLPWALIIVRQSVKKQRQDVIRDLEAVFHPKGSNDREDQIIPSFEFVKFKYFVSQDDKSPGKTVELNPVHHPRDFPFWVLLISSAPLSIMLFVFGLIAFGAIFFVSEQDIRAVFSQNFNNETLSADLGQDLKLWDLLAVFIVAYLATYLYVVRDLLRAISNFDFGPTTLLASAIHVLFGVITAVIIAVTAAVVLEPLEATIAAAVILVAAFAVGFIPELGLRTLLRATRLAFFKREDVEVYNAFAATPLEAIDGIDSEVRSRLNLFNIGTVQNLATANPIMLFVETPYGVYQIIDWVAQAQLCSIVGPKGLTRLWELGVRTIFDLEQAMIGRFSTLQLRHEIGRCLLAGRNPPETAKFGLGKDGKPSPETDESIIALAHMMIDDLHVHRLRQIVNRIAERLGSKNTRLSVSDPIEQKSSVREPKPAEQPDGGVGVTRAVTGQVLRSRGAIEGDASPPRLRRNGAHAPTRHKQPLRTKSVPS